jgi:hypothetical protein
MNWSKAIVGSAGDAPSYETSARVERRALAPAWQTEAAFAARFAAAPQGAGGYAPPPPPPPPPAAAQKWWLAANGQSIGPFTREELMQRLGGDFTGSSQVCVLGGSAWQMASTVPGLAELFPPPPPQ